MRIVTMARGALQLLVLLAHGALLLVAVFLLRVVVSLLLVSVFAAAFVLPGTDST